MQLIFKFNGRGVDQAEAWDTVMSFAGTIGLGKDLEYNTMPNGDIRLYYHTRDLDDMRFAIVKDVLSQLADDLLGMSKGGNAELYNGNGEQLLSQTRHDEHLCVIA